MKTYCLIVCGLLLSIDTLSGQCTFNVSAEIPDNQSVTVDIDVQGLLAGDLGSGQSLCAVTLEFAHSYLGDLTIELISPSGQSVLLVGPVTDQINQTNLTTWDVQFIRCDFPAVPDPGFSTTWSNDQAWEILANYTGSYYPHAGCLEDFNTGSANGVWEIVITDNDALQSGTLISAGLVFCDNNGLNCVLCAANAGDFSGTVLDFCEGDVISDDIFDPVYVDSIPDQDFYGYNYLVSEDGMTFTLYDQLTASDFSPGSWTICGLSFDLADSTALFEQLDTLQFSTIIDLFAGDDIVHCADLTAPCLNLTISPESESMLAEVICDGETISVGGEEFGSPGTYMITTQNAAGCDSTIVLELQVDTVRARITQADTLSCTVGSIFLDGTSSTAGTGAEFMWGTVNGIISGPSQQPAVQIEAPGIYTLTVTLPSGCADQASIDVIADQSLPQVYIDDGVIDCNNTSYTFDPVTFPSMVTYYWTGPNGFTSTQPRPTVVEPGVYSLQVQDTSGCVGLGMAEVNIDTARANTNIRVIKQCQIPRTLLVLRPGANEYTYAWTGPNGFSADSRVITTPEPGLYSGTITPPNGCSSSADYIVDDDYTIPDLALSVTDDTLNCNEEITITALSATPGLTYMWTGPGISSTDSSISIQEPGAYAVLVTAPNMCEASAQDTVAQGDDLFEVSSFADTITCLADTVLIGVFPEAEIVDYSWSGPSVADTLQQFALVDEPGQYLVEMLDTSGCVQYANIEVIADRQSINFLASRDTVTCAEPVGTVTIFNVNQPVNSILWSLPDGSMRTDSIVMSAIPGVYRVTVTGENGCPRTRVTRIDADTIPPLLFLESDYLGCADSTDIRPILVDPVTQFAWTGPSGFSSDEESPFVYERGVYVLESTGLNGCTSMDSIFVDTNYIYPSYTLSTEPLDCLDSMAVLTSATTDTSALLSWLHADTLFSDLDVISVSQPGLYVLRVEGDNGCVVEDSVFVAPARNPEVFSTGDTLNCVDTSVTLSAQADTSVVQFEWYRDTTLVSSASSVTTDLPGNYRVVVTASNGCTSDTAVTVSVDTVRPVAVAVVDGVVRCEMRDVALDATMSIGDSLAYLWSTVEGILLSDEMMAVAEARGPGEYLLEIIDRVNGCTDTTTVMVNQEESTLERALITVASECQGDAGGSIEIDSVVGADGPLHSFVNGESQNGGSRFVDLTAGDYMISVVDSFGCRLDTMVTVDELRSEVSVNLGPDQEVLLGDPVLLSAVLAVDTSILSRVFWTPSLSCDSCLQNTVVPTGSGTFAISIVDSFGCVARDEIQIFVTAEARVFVPNVFSPNGDGVNDDLLISFHSGVQTVHQFRIFDRWGNQVHGAQGVDPTDPALIWNGRFEGEEVNPGVFGYILEVELINGRRQFLSADITLVR